MSEASQRDEPGALEPKQQSLLRSSALMASGTLVSRILGFVRSAMLVAAIGVTAGAAVSFQVANTLPTQVYNLLAAGVLDAVLVPQIVKALRTKGGSPYVNKLITAVGSILFLLTIAAMVATPLLVTLFAPTLAPATRALAITFALWCAPQIFFYGVYNLFGQVLNARGVFGPYMWAPVVNNIIGIASLAVFLTMWGGAGVVRPAASFTAEQTVVLAGSATLGIVAQALVLVIPLRRSGVRLKPDFNLRGTSFGTAPKVAMWTFATLMVSQVGVISTSNLATRGDAWTDATGQVVAGLQAYQYAFMVFMLPQSLIAVTIVTAMFTNLAKNVADGDTQAVARGFNQGTRLVLMLCMVSAAVLVVVATPLMQILMPTFGTAEASLYGGVLVALAIGVPSIGVTMMAQRVFFAMENARPVFLMGIAPAIVQLAVGWGVYFLASGAWWTIGAAAGETAARVLQGFIAMYMVSRVVPLVNFGHQVGRYLRYFAAFGVSALVGWGLMHLIGPGSDSSSGFARMFQAGWKTILVSLVILVVYFGVLRILDPTGFRALSSTVAARLGRRRAVPVEDEGAAADLGTVSDEGSEAEAHSGRHALSEDDLVTEGQFAAAEAELQEPGSLATGLTAAELAAAELASAASLAQGNGERDGTEPPQFEAATTRPAGWSEEAPAWEDIFGSGSGVAAIGRSLSMPDPSSTGALPVLTGAMMRLAESGDDSASLAEWMNRTLPETGVPQGQWQPVPRIPSRRDVQRQAEETASTVAGAAPKPGEAPSPSQPDVSDDEWSANVSPADEFWPTSQSPTAGTEPYMPTSLPETSGSHGLDDVPPSDAQHPPHAAAPRGAEPSLSTHSTAQPPQGLTGTPRLDAGSGALPSQPRASGATNPGSRATMPPSFAPSFPVGPPPPPPSGAAVPSPAPQVLAATTPVGGPPLRTTRIPRGGALDHAGTVEVDQLSDLFAGQQNRESIELMSTGSLPGSTAGKRKGSGGKFNPTVPALLIGLLVLIGAIWFVSNNLFPSETTILVEQSAQSEQSGQSGEEALAEGAEGEGEGEVALAPPVVSSATVLSWSDDDGDHPEVATSMLDADPGTYWRSRYFADAGYLQGPPIAILLNLQQPALVTQVTLNVIGSGGEVAVVDASDGDPRGGAILATSSLDGDTVIRLAEPTEVSKLGLVFNALPVDDEGRNRAKIIAVSVE